VQFSYQEVFRGITLEFRIDDLLHIMIIAVNNFQNIRSQMGATAVLSLQVDEGAHYEAQLDIFKLDQLEMEHIESDDPLVDWEAEVFHNLELVRALKAEMSPLLWPRDTMFQYLMLLESYSSNLDERKRILTLLG